MLADLNSSSKSENARQPATGFCFEKSRLLDEFVKATQEMIALQNQQMQAVIQGESDFPRFDVLLHLAQERKELAKYAWIAHVESHGCGEG